MKKSNYVAVIGASNMDIQGVPKAAFKLSDSNPGTISYSCGGVGRNISENLARMGINVRFFSVIGDDANGQTILNVSKEAGMDVNHVQIVQKAITPTYLSILDSSNNMIAAISDMHLCDLIDISYLRSNHDSLENAELLVLDANLPQDSIDYLFDTYSHKPIFFDTVSTAKANKIKKHLSNVHTLKPNLLEAQLLTGFSLAVEADVKQAGNFFISLGVKQIIISMEADGVYGQRSNEAILIKNVNTTVKSATGAGDAFMAGLAYSFLAAWPLKKTIGFAQTTALLTLQHDQSVNPDLNTDLILNRMEKNNYA